MFFFHISVFYDYTGYNELIQDITNIVEFLKQVFFNIEKVTIECDSHVM